MRDVLLQNSSIDKKLKDRKIKHCPQVRGIINGKAGIELQKTCPYSTTDKYLISIKHVPGFGLDTGYTM